MKGFNLLETEICMLHRKLMASEAAELGVIDLTVERLDQLVAQIGIAESFDGSDCDLERLCIKASGEVFITRDRKRARTLLVDPQGADYPRYMAYLPRSLVTASRGSLIQRDPS